MQKPPSLPKNIEHRLCFRVVIRQPSPHNVGIDVIFPILLEVGLLTRPFGLVYVDRTGHAKVPRPRSVFGIGTVRGNPSRGNPCGAWPTWRRYIPRGLSTCFPIFACHVLKRATTLSGTTRQLVVPKRRSAMMPQRK